MSANHTNAATTPETLEDAPPARSNSYGEILKSSVLIGGSQVFVIALGIIRTKAMALMLGPAGFGLMGLYTAIIDLTKSVAEMGINSSGVREIAAAVGSEDDARIARTVTALRRIAVVLGLLAVVLLVALSGPLSQLTFGNDGHVGAVALLSVAVLLRIVADGQGALIQGMRRIADLAKIGVFGALASTVFAIAMVYWLREDGVVPSLIGIAGFTLLASWWYSRKVRIDAPRLGVADLGHEAASLLKLGSAFMASALMMMGAAYVVRTLVLRFEGLEAAGFYQAAWTLGGLYVGMILQAMGADFYPRLTAAAKDAVRANRLVNEQAQVSLLLAGPGVLGTLSFAPLLMVLFYSSEFHAATDVLRWICLGMTLRVVSWPIGYILIARGERALFFFTELGWTSVNLALSWFAIRYFGLDGAGMAFMAAYVVHCFVVYAIVRRLTGFRWSAANREVALTFFALTAVVFCGFIFLPTVWAMVVGVSATAVSGIYALRRLLVLVGTEQLPAPLVKVLEAVRPLIGLAR